MLQLLFDFFGGKAKTKIYTTFLGWFFIFHIDILFIAIFTDQSIIFEKTKQLKGEYVWSYITNFDLLTNITIEIDRLAFAAAITFLMIWVIPKLISEKSYKAELEVEYTLRKMKVDKEEVLNKREERVVKREGRVVKKQLDNIKAEKVVAVERAKLDEAPQHINWDLEFDDFIKIRNGLDTLKEISNTVYAEGGNLSHYTDANGWGKSPTGIKPDNLALSDTNDLVTFTDKGKMLALTDKGKYYIKKMSSL